MAVSISIFTFSVYTASVGDYEHNILLFASGLLSTSMSTLPEDSAMDSRRIRNPGNRRNNSNAVSFNNTSRRELLAVEIERNKIDRE